MENEEDKQMTTPPEIPEELKVENEWAEKLGMDYDPLKAMEQKAEEKPEPAAPEVQPEQEVRQAPPMYVMPPEEPLPQENQGFPRREPAREPMPPTFMLWSIISTICCCLPAGVVAIFLSAQVSTKYYARDYEGAKRMSRRAEAWIIASIVLGVVFNSLYAPLSILSMPGI